MDGRPGRSDVRYRKSLHRHGLGANPPCRCGGRRPCGHGSHAGVQRAGMVGLERQRPWRPDPAFRRSSRRQCRPPGRHRNPRQWQADRRDARPAQIHAAMVPLFRRAGRQGRGTRHPDRQARRVQLHPRGAAGRGGRHHSVEFAVDAGDLETGSGAGCRQHHRLEALRVLLRFGPRIRGAFRGSRLSARGRQHRHRLRQRDRRTTGVSSGRRQGRLHRRRPHRPGRLPDRGSVNKACHAGTWREIRQHRLRGRGA